MTAFHSSSVPQPSADTRDNHAYAARLSNVRYQYAGSHDWALDRITLDITPGEYVCVVGANGSGKSTLARLIAGLSAPDSGSIILDGHTVFDAQGAHAEQYRRARHDIGAVFQNPEDQIVTTVTGDDVAFGPENLGMHRDRISERVAYALNAVGMAGHAGDDPTTMSGGQQQRVAIAGIIAMNPGMVVLDEPTAMLDQDARMDVLAILDALHAHGTTIVHVTHHADEAKRGTRIIAMKAGRIISDEAPAVQAVNTSQADDPVPQDFRQLLQASGLPVTWLHSIPDCGNPSPPQTRHNGNAKNLTRHSEPAIRVDNVSFTPQGADHPSVQQLSFSVDSGETLALMGSNGAGKTTVLRLLSALAVPDEGDITIAGVPVATDRRHSGGVQRLLQRVARLFRPRIRPLSRSQRVTLRHRLGLVMQHPEQQLFAETVAEDVAYGPRNLGLSEQEVTRRVDEALNLLHISDLRDRSPFSLSGGQQRLAAIAGVIACHPDVLLLDEPTASLDETASARIRTMLVDLHRRGVTILLVTHSVDEARAVADRVLVLQAPTSTGYPDTKPVGMDSARSTMSNASSRQAVMSPVPDRDDGAPMHARARSGRSIIGLLDARVKVVAFLALMFSAFAIRTPWQLAMGALLTVGVVAASRIRPMQLFIRVHMFLFLFVFAGALNIFFVRTGTPLAHLGPIPITDDGIHIALIYACRFALVIILGAVFVETTTPTAMTDAFELLFSPLKRCGVHVQEIALVLSLALRFLPTLRLETVAIAEAQAARGGSIESGSPARRCRAMCAIIMPVFAASLRHADNLSLALDARSYEEGIHRTHWHAMRLQARDGVFCVVCVLYLVSLGLATIL